MTLVYSRWSDTVLTCYIATVCSAVFAQLMDTDSDDDATIADIHRLTSSVACTSGKQRKTQPFTEHIFNFIMFCHDTTKRMQTIFPRPICRYIPRRVATHAVVWSGLWPEVVPDTDAKPVSFCGGRCKAPITGNYLPLQHNMGVFTPPLKLFWHPNTVRHWRC